MRPRGIAWPPFGGPVAPPLAVLRAPGVFGENRFWRISGNFPGKLISAQKIDTKGNSAENSVSPCYFGPNHAS